MARIDFGSTLKCSASEMTNLNLHLHSSTGTGTRLQLCPARPLRCASAMFHSRHRTAAQHSPPSSPFSAQQRDAGFHGAQREACLPCLARTLCGRRSLQLLLCIITSFMWAYVLVFFEPGKEGLGGGVKVAQHGSTLARFRGEGAEGGSGSAASLSSGGSGSASSSGGGGCASVAPAYVEARLKGAVARRTRPCHQTHVGGSPFTTSTILRVHPCVRAFGGSSRLASATLHMRDVLFVVMSGLLEIERLYAVRQTWGSLVPNVLAIGEANHRASGMITLDELAGKHTYNDAQHRSLLGLKHAVSLSAYRHCAWVVLVDDDTYVNVHELPGFLVGWDARLPLLFGHIWYGPEMRGKDEGAWPSGGAGIILSRRAAEMLSAALYTETCPFLGLNDVTLGHCATRLGIPMVRRVGGRRICSLFSLSLFLSFSRSHTRPLPRTTALAPLLQIHSPVFDPEGNVFVPGYKEVKRKIRKDGKFIRPTDGFTVSAAPRCAHWHLGPPASLCCRSPHTHFFFSLALAYA